MQVTNEMEKKQENAYTREKHTLQTTTTRIFGKSNLVLLH